MGWEGALGSCILVPRISEEHGFKNTQLAPPGGPTWSRAPRLALRAPTPPAPALLDHPATAAPHCPHKDYTPGNRAPRPPGWRPHARHGMGALKRGQKNKNKNKWSVVTRHDGR